MIVWQGQSGHFLEAFCRVQFLKWTNRNIDNRADGIHLIMQASVHNRKEMLALGFLSREFLFPFIEEVGLDKVSDLIDLSETNFHFTVNIIHATSTNTIVWRIL